MQNAIILHGRPSKEEYYNPESEAQSNKHWIPWIQRRFLLNDILAQTPELPRPYDPVYEEWKHVFEQHDITPETILIGHSCGGGFLLRWLSENEQHVGTVVLVAPWLDPKHKLASGMFDFTIDPVLTDRVAALHIMYSTDDSEYILTSVETIRAALPAANYHEFTDKEHFCYNDLGTVRFPELETIVLGKGK